MRKLLKTGIVALLLSVSFPYNTVQAAGDTDTIDLSNDTVFSGFGFLDSAALSSDVFMNGENHSYLSSNKKLWVKMIKYLHQNAGVRNVVLEYGFSAGYLIDEYIQTGDTNMFNILQLYSFDQHTAAYKELMEFNKTLDSGEKIHIIGIDLERGFRTAVKAMCLLIDPEARPDDSIALHIESLQGLCTYNDNVVLNRDKQTYRDDYSSRNTIKRLIQNFHQNEASYRDLLKEDFGTFQKIVLGLEDLHDWYLMGEENAVQDYVYREMYMFSRFREEWENREGKFFGQFGRCHSARSVQEETSCNWYSFRSLAHRIENWKQGDEKLKVLTTGIFYRIDNYDLKGWEGVSEVFDSIFRKEEDNRIRYYDYRRDAVLRDKLSDMFDYVILNTYQQDRDYPGVRPYQEKQRAENVNDRVYLQFGGSFQGMDLNSLKPVISLYDYQHLFAYSVDLVMTGSTGFGGGFGFCSVIPVIDTLADTLSVKLSGYSFTTYYTYDIANKWEFLDIEPRIGYGLARLKLQYEEKFSEGPDRNNRLGERRVSTYTNPAFIFDFGLTVRLNFKLFKEPFNIGATGGYQFDLSRANWLTKSGEIDAPLTSLSGSYMRLFLGVRFN